MDARVRRAAVDDAAEVARVHIETWRVAYAHVFPTDYLAGLSIEDRTERWRENLATSETDVFVAESEERVIGFAAAGPARDEHKSAPPAELFALYVDPQEWGKGLGRSLLERVETALRDRGFEEAGLWVLEDNPRARRFYEKAGWVADGATDTYSRAGIDAPDVRYRKRLS
jgi:GNAT superfamily N-acetyltransferase